MPSPKDRAKLTGDTHPPEVESDLPLQKGLRDQDELAESPAASAEQTQRTPRTRKPKQQQPASDSGRGYSPDDPQFKDETRLG